MENHAGGKDQAGSVRSQIISPNKQTNNTMKAKKQTISIQTGNVEVLTEILYQTQTKLQLFAIAKAAGVSCDAVKYTTAQNIAAAVNAAKGEAFIVIKF